MFIINFLQLIPLKFKPKMTNPNQYSAKAGKFSYDLSTKKVRVSKDKGKLCIHTNEQGQTYFSWINLDQNLEELSIIVFPFDAVFQRVENQNNTYVLRFQSNDDKYFFYLQEKINSEEFVKVVNDKIAFVPSEPSMDVEQSSESHVEVNQREQVTVPQPVQKVQAKGNQTFNLDFIKRLQSNLLAAKGNQTDITHLSKILTPETINNFLSELTPQQKNQFLQHLPQEQKDVKFIASNVRSPQFQQAVDVLTDALNSENGLPIFMQLNLDQKHLKRHYGVHAFLKAMDEKLKQPQKKENN